MEGSSLGESVDQGLATVPGIPHPEGGLVPIADPLEAEELRLLTEIANGVRSNPVSFALIDQGVPPATNTDFPAEGNSRQVIPRTPVGGIFDVPSLSVPAAILAPNPNRVAGGITNMGRADCLLILADAEQAGSPAGLGVQFLVAHGGHWDMRLGTPLWCGSVSAFAIKTEAGEEAFEETRLAVVEA